MKRAADREGGLPNNAIEARILVALETYAASLDSTHELDRLGKRVNQIVTHLYAKKASYVAHHFFEMATDLMHTRILPWAAQGRLRFLLSLRLVSRRWCASVTSNDHLLIRETDAFGWLSLTYSRALGLFPRLSHLEAPYDVLYHSMAALTSLRSLVFSPVATSQQCCVNNRSVSIASLTNLTALEYNRTNCPRLLDLTALSQLRVLVLDHVHSGDVDVTRLSTQLTSLSVLLGYTDGWGARWPHFSTTLTQLKFLETNSEEILRDGGYSGQAHFTDLYEDYMGGYCNGEKHGRGTVSWFHGGTYTGEWCAGKRHGYGIYTRDYDHYEGEWVNDQRQPRSGTCR